MATVIIRYARETNTVAGRRSVAERQVLPRLATAKMYKAICTTPVHLKSVTLRINPRVTWSSFIDRIDIKIHPSLNSRLTKVEVQAQLPQSTTLFPSHTAVCPLQ